MRKATLRIQVVLLLVFSLLALWSCTVYLVGHTKQQAIAEAELRTRGIAHAFAEHALSTIKRIDSTLKQLSHTWVSRPVDFTSDIRRIEETISDISIQVAVTDSQGVLVYSNLGIPKERLNLADREHIKVHMSTSEDRLFISKPVKGRVSGKWSIQFTRPVFRDGRFDGVIVISVSPDVFSRFFETLSLGSQDIATLIRDSGEVMARTPDWEKYVGQTVSGTPYLAVNAPVTDNFRRVAQTDGVERLYGYYRLPEYRLSLVAGLSVNSILNSVESQRRVAIGVATLVSILLTGIALIIRRNLKLREEAEAETRSANIRLEQRVGERTEELLRANKELSEAIALNNDILATSVIGVATYRKDGQCIQANPAFAKIFDVPLAEVLAQNFRDLPAWQECGLKNAADDVLTTGTAAEFETEMRAGHGRSLHLYVHLSLFSSRGEPHLLLIVRDTTDQKLAETQLQLAASVFHNSAEGVLVTDVSGTILSVNPAFTKITGYTADEVMGKKPNLLRSEHHDAAFYSQLWASLAQDGRWIGEVWNQHKSGEAYLQWMTINAVQGSDGKPVRYVSVFHDITELRQKDEHIRHLAFHDALTELPNRTLFQERLERAVSRSKREGTRLSVTFIDLDGFKDINDALGHDTGDLLLKEVARRISTRMRRGTDTVARLGGDEFVVLMEDLKEAEHCASLAAAMISDIAIPVALGSQTVRVGASMGIAFYPEDGDNAQELMKRADTAMYAAKAAGKGTYRFFSNRMLDAVTQKLTMQEELRLAIERGELVLYYQPKVCVVTGDVQGVEALVRWAHPVRGLVPPNDFLPLAEESGLILELGDWVMAAACRQAAAWRTQGTPTCIAVNISVQQIAKGDLVHRVSRLMAQYQLPANALQIELTETALMADSGKAVEVLGQLREMGISIAVDDFGTGYSSLSRLRSLPIDLLKIDRSFVMNAHRDDRDAVVVRTIIALARNLGMDVVAEGVESEEHVEMLSAAGCLICQGYHYSRPQPAEQLDALLRNGFKEKTVVARQCFAAIENCDVSASTGDSRW